MTTIESLHRLSDEHLLEETLRLSTREREATARFIGALAELDARRLYLVQGYPSLFAYCTQRLHFSEHAALNRIEAARAARFFPIILDRIAEAGLTLTAVRLLRPVLTPDNHEAVIERACHSTTKEVELLVAGLQPKPPVPSTVRKLPTSQSERATPETQTATSVLEQPPEPLDPPSSRRPIVKPLSAESYRLQITMSVGTHDKLRRAQALMRHRIPNGDPATIFDQALDALIREIERRKCAHVERPRAGTASAVGSRHIPSSVRRDVWKRDDARCVFVGPNSQRCGATDFLEFHHVVPYARGGAATVENIELRCRAHNLYEAEREFGLFVRGTRPDLEGLEG